MKTKQTKSDEPLLPPYNLDVENAVIGSFLLRPSALINVNMLNRESFYSPENQLIFETIEELIKKSKDVDILTVTAELNRTKRLKDVGGPGYIARLTNAVASGEHLESHCYLLIEYETARRQIKFGSELLKKAYDTTEDVFATNEFMMEQIQSITSRSVLTKEISNAELANEFQDRVLRAKDTRGITGVPTGFTKHDKLIGGLQPSDFIILAARPSMGKTALALCYFRNSVVLYQRRMIFFSLEMSAQQLFQRLISIHMNMPANKFKSGDVSEYEWRYYNENLEPLLTSNLVIVDDCHTLGQIIMRSKKEQLKGLDGIIIDYLQLIELPGQKVREQEVSTISRNLKKLAKELNVPILALSQLSRAVESRADKRPMLSDLRESGSIEQDADIVQFLYRPNYYGNAETGKEDLAWLCIEKHRNGELQDIDLRYHHSLTKFTDYEDEIEF